jgi:hypothetical protein
VRAEISLAAVGMDGLQRRAQHMCKARGIG